MSSFELLFPCPTCKGRIPENAEKCPSCDLEVVLTPDRHSFRPKSLQCPTCKKMTDSIDRCEHCNSEISHDPKSDLPDRVYDRDYDLGKPVKVTHYDIVKNPLVEIIGEQRLDSLGFQFPLKWSHIFAGALVFFAGRITFFMTSALLFNSMGDFSIFNPFPHLIFLLTGVLTGIFTGMRGGGIIKGALGSILFFLLLGILIYTPSLIFDLVGLDFLAPWDSSECSPVNFWLANIFAGLPFVTILGGFTGYLTGMNRL